MSNAWVLMTAMPPTKGHLALMEFAAALPVNRAYIVVCTQPGEPFADERYHALLQHSRRVPRTHIKRITRPLPQDPNSEGFWDMWRDIMKTGDHGRWFVDGAQPGDFFVSSEPYGARLAKECNGVFFPFDPQRELVPTRATAVRKDPIRHFSEIAPEFQYFMRTNVTIFGAESTGKTTLSKEIAGLLDAHWLFEWARPYLETVGPDITKESMDAIWKGQSSAQVLTDYWYDKPYLIQDTDLFSTVGYWQQPHWESELGPCPEFLVQDAIKLQSDLYIITRSNIAFEADPIRYGGDHRESPDAYWIGVAERYNLPYVVLNSSGFNDRVAEAMSHIRKAAKQKTAVLNYEREHNELNLSGSK